ncbi:hypothetical protein ABZX99_02985 [Streptomyces antibioticus]|uniref:hypothetical protein n=1 Tax=Streptomyces antibioticus TaxID=1890 RepID=UPI0033A52743
MRHRTTAIVGLLAALAVAGCSASTADSKPSATGTTAGLAAEWGPKLKQATAADPAVCNAVGDQACAEHLTDIAIAVTELEGDIADEGGKAAYPETSAQIDKNNAAVQAYTDHECLGDENAGIQGSPCPDDVQTILSTAEALPLALQADEAQ